MWALLSPHLRQLRSFASSRQFSSRGFTIVELLIVIVVIAVLAAISMVAYNGITNRARTSALASSLSQAAKKVQTHAATNSDVLPVDLATVGVASSADTIYQYTRNTASTPHNYCITATSNGFSSHIASNGIPTEGPCPGHTGTAPTVAANGESCPTNFIVVPGSSLYGTRAFCVMKYEAKDAGSNVPVSQASGSPWASITQINAIAYAPNTAGCTGCHLVTENEWLTIAQNVMSVGSNWSGGSVGSGNVYRGHSDSVPGNSIVASTNDADGYINTGQTSGTQRRTLTLTNNEVIWDFAGNLWEWTASTTEGGKQPGGSGYTWRQWNAVAVPGGLSPNPFPVYANPSADSWTSTEGIGQLYSDSTVAGIRALRRGGYWGTGSGAGIYALDMSLAPDSTNGNGFRVAR